MELFATDTEIIYADSKKQIWVISSPNFNPDCLCVKIAKLPTKAKTIELNRYPDLEQELLAVIELIEQK